MQIKIVFDIVIINDFLSIIINNVLLRRFVDKTKHFFKKYVVFFMLDTTELE